MLPQLTEGKLPSDADISESCFPALAVKWGSSSIHEPINSAHLGTQSTSYSVASINTKIREADWNLRANSDLRMQWRNMGMATPADICSKPTGPDSLANPTLLL